MIFHELIIGEIILHEILELILEQNIIIDGDDYETQNQIDTIHEIQEARDSDHVIRDIMCQVDENGKP